MKVMPFKLQPSLFHGVGVFTLQDFDEGVVLPLFDEGEDGVMILHPEKLYGDEWEEMQHFCIQLGEHVWTRPVNFRNMSPGWYMNHSDTPNAQLDRELNEYVALRPIKTGEEITIDYTRFSEWEKTP